MNLQVDKKFLNKSAEVELFINRSVDWYFFVIFSPQYFSLAQGHGDNYGSKILTNRSLLPLKGISNIQIFTRIARKLTKLLPPTEWEGVLRYNKS